MGVLRGRRPPVPPSRAEPGRVWPSRAAPDRAGQSRAELGRVEPSLAEPGRTGPGRGGAPTPRPGPCCALTALRATGQNRHRPRCI